MVAVVTDGNRILRVALVLLVLLELQLHIVDGIQIAGHHPVILFLVPIAAALEGDGSRAAVAGFVTGLVFDLFLETPLGLTALVFAIVGYGVASFERGVIRADRWLQPAVAGVASALGVVGIGMAAAIFGEPQYFRVSLIGSVLVVGVFNAIVATPVIRAVRWALGPVAVHGSLHA
ncbi:MAG TPA: rod shape-determining protein MreD [Acidimicrobiales bacterium]|nr:rod shape-determining protein MreD [Acidimicrobiales bacterium]